MTINEPAEDDLMELAVELGYHWPLDDQARHDLVGEWTARYGLTNDRAADPEDQAAIRSAMERALDQQFRIQSKSGTGSKTPPIST